MPDDLQMADKMVVNLLKYLPKDIARETLQFWAKEGQLACKWSYAQATSQGTVEIGDLAWRPYYESRYPWPRQYNVLPQAKAWIVSSILFQFGPTKNLLCSELSSLEGVGEQRLLALIGNDIEFYTHNLSQLMEKPEVFATMSPSFGDRPGRTYSKQSIRAIRSWAKAFYKEPYQRKVFIPKPYER
jgi:hypothetical protein